MFKISSYFFIFVEKKERKKTCERIFVEREREEKKTMREGEGEEEKREGKESPSNSMYINIIYRKNFIPTAVVLYNWD